MNLKSITDDWHLVLGNIKTGESSVVVFGIEEYKGIFFGVVRKFIFEDNYSGPTKSGLNANSAIWSQILEELNKAETPKGNYSYEIVRIPIGEKDAAQLYASFFSSTFHIAFAKIYNQDNYKGFGKAAAIEWKDKSTVISYLEQMIAELNRLDVGGSKTENATFSPLAQEHNNASLEPNINHAPTENSTSNFKDHLNRIKKRLNTD